MGFWGKVKGVFGRIGKGIKNVATKAYDWISGNKDKIKDVANTLNENFGGQNKDKFQGWIDKGSQGVDKGLDFAKRGADVIKKFVH